MDLRGDVLSLILLFNIGTLENTNEVDNYGFFLFIIIKVSCLLNFQRT